MNRAGQDAEQRTQAFLQNHGLKILACNFSSKVGEIDIVAQDGSIIVFVEVRFRKQNRFGQAYETVTPAKQKKIVQTALMYLQKHQLVEKHPCRFDIVALDTESEPLWIKDAFQAN